MKQFRLPRRHALLGHCVLSVFLLSASGCSTLPASGPTGKKILDPSVEEQARLPFAIVEVDTAAALPAVPGSAISTLIPPEVQPTDMVGRGDVLNVSIYEAGISLFGGGSRAATSNASAAPAFDVSSNAEKIQVRVDDEGYITLPFTGPILAAGQTARQLALVIRLGLQGFSQDPQVLVTFAQSLTSSVMFAGEIARPGRLVLNTNQETLSDSIALAGGFRGEARDIVARVQRAGQTYEVRLEDLLSSPALDLPIAPGDKVTLVSRPQSFSVLGAPNKSEEIRFPKTKLTLAQAIALSGGANPNAGDAAAVFVFRYVLQQDGTELPVVYHVNLMRPNAYFLAQRFRMRDGDVLYIGNARANQPTKLIQLISQLFAPIVTVRNVATGL